MAEECEDVGRKTHGKDAVFRSEGEYQKRTLIKICYFQTWKKVSFSLILNIYAVPSLFADIESEIISGKGLGVELVFNPLPTDGTCLVTVQQRRLT